MLSKKRVIIFGILAIVLVISFLALRFVFTGRVVEETQKTTKTYIHARTLLASKSSDSENVDYYIQDHLGSNKKVIGGQVQIEKNKYYDFGETTEEQSSGNNYKYTGKELDDEIGLYYYGARYYKPEFGRFVQADVLRGDISDPLSLNRYVYVKNNPLKYIDPTGNEEYKADKLLKKSRNVYNKLKELRKSHLTNPFLHEAIGNYDPTKDTSLVIYPTDHMEDYEDVYGESGVSNAVFNPLDHSITLDVNSLTLETGDLSMNSILFMVHELTHARDFSQDSENFETYKKVRQLEASGKDIDTDTLIKAYTELKITEKNAYNAMVKYTSYLVRGKKITKKQQEIIIQKIEKMRKDQIQVIDNEIKSLKEEEN